jgi:hypothetical protein
MKDGTVRACNTHGGADSLRLQLSFWKVRRKSNFAHVGMSIHTHMEITYVRGLFKKYPDWNCSGCSLGGMCLQPVLTCSYMS